MYIQFPNIWIPWIPRNSYPYLLIKIDSYIQIWESIHKLMLYELYIQFGLHLLYGISSENRSFLIELNRREFICYQLLLNTFSFFSQLFKDLIFLNLSDTYSDKWVLMLCYGKKLWGKVGKNYVSWFQLISF